MLGRSRWRAAFERNGTVVSLMAALGIALVLFLSIQLNTAANFWAAHPVVAGFVLQHHSALGDAGRRHRDFRLRAGRAVDGRCGISGATPARARRSASGAIAVALHDVFTLKNLGGGGNGCNDNSEAFSMRRRRLHHAMFYGFLLCFAATCTGFVYHTFLDWAAPYPLISAPVVLGTVGGVLMLIGTIGLFAMKLVDDPMPAVRRLLGGDVALLMLLAMIALTGLVLLAVRVDRRDGPGDGGAPGLHPGVLRGAPYSKMVHGVYRSAALLRRAAERNMKPLGGEVISPSRW